MMYTPPWSAAHSLVMVVAGWAAGVMARPPLTPDPQTAREWVSEHHDTPFSLLDLILGWLARLFHDSQIASNPGTAAVTRIVAAVVVIGLVLWLIYLRIKTVQARKRQTGLAAVPFDTAATSPDFYQEYLQSRLSDPDSSVIAAFRFLVTGIDASLQTLPLRGRTAGEIASHLTRLHPAHSADLTHASQLFNLAAYGTDEPPRTRPEDADFIASLARQLGAHPPATVSTPSLSGPVTASAGGGPNREGK